MAAASDDTEVASLAGPAIELARRWAEEAAADPELDPAAECLAGMLRDPDGLPFARGFVDGVMRPESLTAAATELNRIAPLVPDFLPWYLRSAVRAGGALAPVLPAPTVPLARRALRDLVSHLFVDSRPGKLGPVLARLRQSGATLNINLLGEAVLGDGEAKRRLAAVHELIRRPDVDYVSVKVSAIAGRISPWAFDETVEEVVVRLRPLCRDAVATETFLNLDMEEYRDLDLTIAVFTRLLEEPGLERLTAGIALQAYLPDTLPALQELTAWARARVAAGGAPIKVRLVKGANLAMERVDAALHDWTPTVYDTKLDTDANYLRCLDWALDPDRVGAVRIGVAGHNLFDIAYAWLLAERRGLTASAWPDETPIEFEMLLGMAQGQMRAVAATVGRVRLYVPVVAPDEFDVAISYLMRRLDESASNEDFLSAAHALMDDSALWERERDRFVASLERSTDPALRIGARRGQDRSGNTAAAPAILRDAPVVDEEHGLTQAVLGIAEAVAAEPDLRAVVFGGAEFVETAVYAPRESGLRAIGAPGFRNAADSDPALAGNREWAREVLGRVETSRAGDRVADTARVTAPETLDRIVTEVRGGAARWGALAAADRALVLQLAARALEERRGELIEAAASETGKVFAEADSEVSEAVDLAGYYAATARELDRVSGAVFEPSRLTVVAPPWNFPISIPAGGALAALAAGSGVILKPAPQARRVAAVVAEALWQAGIPRDVLRLVDIDEEDLGRELIEHPGVDRVILTGAWETARRFRSWRPDLRLQAETSGKNAIIVTPSADLDLAAADLVRSAFSHAGQKCSAASLVILVGATGRSARFARQLLDATTSLRVGRPSDPAVEIGPLVSPPGEALRWALTQLGDGERWLVQPRELTGEPEFAGRLWTPGIRTGVLPGSRFHLEEFFGPVLGIMHAPTLAAAVDLQNAVAYGLTAGLHTREEAELRLWLERVEAGNLFVNRGITGAVVQRQPFGGWKRSAVGEGGKPGGPNHLVGLGSWRPTHSGAPSPTLHLRGLDSRITVLIEAAQPALDYERFEWLRRAALSDAVEWDREFGQVRDVSGLRVERNLFRYRPAAVAVRAVAGAGLPETLRVVLAGIRAGSAFLLSVAEGLPAGVRRALGEAGVVVSLETDDQWLERVTADAASRPSRVRLIGDPDAVSELRTRLAEASDGDPDVAVWMNPVTTAGRLELLPFLREQAISITAHRFGAPDPWSAEVI